MEKKAKDADLQPLPCTYLDVILGEFRPVGSEGAVHEVGERQIVGDVELRSTLLHGARTGAGA